MQLSLSLRSLRPPNPITPPPFENVYSVKRGKAFTAKYKNPPLLRTQLPKPVISPDTNPWKSEFLTPPVPNFPHRTNASKPTHPANTTQLNYDVNFCCTSSHLRLFCSFVEMGDMCMPRSYFWLDLPLGLGDGRSVNWGFAWCGGGFWCSRMRNG